MPRFRLALAAVGVILLIWITTVLVRAPTVAGDADEVAQLRAAVILLEKEVSELKGRVAAAPRSVKTGTGEAVGATSGSLLERLEYLERAVAEIQFTQAPASVPEQSTLAQLSARSPERIEQAEKRRYQQAERRFQTQPGAFDAGRAEHLGYLFRSNSSLQLGDVQCKGAVCRVSFREVDTEPGPGGSSLENTLDEVMDSWGGSGLDVRYATSETGERVVYIKTLER